MFEDPGELDVIKLAVADGSFFVHVVDFVMGKTVPQSRQNLTKVVLMQHACVSLVQDNYCRHMQKCGKNAHYRPLVCGTLTPYNSTTKLLYYLDLVPSVHMHVR